MIDIQARYILQIGNFKLSETVIVSWIIVAAIALMCFLLTRNLKKIPTSKTQILLEFAVSKSDAYLRSVMNEKAQQIVPGIIPYIFGVFLFFWASNLAGLVGFRSPTVDLDTTLAWATITVILIYYAGIKSKGASYFKEFVDPNPLFLPLNLVGEIARPISLSFRPFGNIMGGTIIMALVYKLLEYISHLFVNIPFAMFVIPIPLHFYFDLFAGTLQAFIFIMLTVIFTSNQVE